MVGLVGSHLGAGRVTYSISLKASHKDKLPTYYTVLTLAIYNYDSDKSTRDATLPS